MHRTITGKLTRVGISTSPGADGVELHVGGRRRMAERRTAVWLSAGEARKVAIALLEAADVFEEQH